MSSPAAIVKKPRPARGTPAEARARLVAAAAMEFERVGYFATDSNRIARVAGYAAGQFYRHFDDKLDAFLAVYDTWVADEWRELGALAAEGGDRRARLVEVVEFLVEHHRRWKTVRAALRALVATEPRARKHQFASRARQLDAFAALHGRGFDRDVGVMAMLYAERICDAIAFGELEALGADEAFAKASMVETLLMETDD